MSTVLPISARKTGEFARELEERGYGNPDLQLLIDNIAAVAELIERQRGNGTTPALATPIPDNWIDELLASEQERFGDQYDLSPARAIFAQYSSEQIARWQAMKKKICIWPEIPVTAETDLPWWKTKPKDFYWQALDAGNLLVPDASGTLVSLTQARFGGIVALVDTSKKPEYKDGDQFFAKDRDFLGSVLAQLRKDAKIAGYKQGRQGSRFGVSAKEFDDHIQAALAKHLGLRVDQVRLETALEMNMVPQLYPELPRAKDGTSNTWVWLHERFKSAAGRLDGGHSDYGGLAGVNWHCATGRAYLLAFRPLGVLGSWGPGT